MRLLSQLCQVKLNLTRPFSPMKLEYYEPYDMAQIIIWVDLNETTSLRLAKIRQVREESNIRFFDLFLLTTV